ncbi:hypothetical protein KQX54_003246 [Cotesia glomerata]|uniref:Uncharacterized protein n=1 Tax=Cotesia glomerata TaxID=32391 RepID=A0AAV7J5S5_COTGL|nr:hypothetical protein KQX54_003246 [Cotesia glomerata]
MANLCAYVLLEEDGQWTLPLNGSPDSCLVRTQSTSTCSGLSRGFSSAPANSRARSAPVTLLAIPGYYSSNVCLAYRRVTLIEEEFYEEIVGVVTGNYWGAMATEAIWYPSSAIVIILAIRVYRLILGVAGRLTPKSTDLQE